MPRMTTWLPLALLLVIVRPVLPQELADASSARRPRFLLATSTGTKPLDIRATPVLMRRFALDLDGVSLRDALRTITDRTGLRLVFNDEVVPLDTRVHLKADDIAVAAALMDVLLDTGIDVVLHPGGYAVLTRRTDLVKPQQTGSISGRVTDTKSQGVLVGATVVVEGTRLSASTGSDGRYTVKEVPPGTYTLRARYIGYAPGTASVSVTDGQEVTADFALEKATTLGEVVVTAQKREERLIDAPQAVTVLSAADLTKTGAVQFRDFANTVPGLSFTTLGTGMNQVSLRGVTTGSERGASVGIYVDDVPYGSSSALAAGAALALDVGLFDLDHVEVLRGPQGTLYGASTIGGLLKYVTHGPDASKVNLNAQAGTAGTRGGGVNATGAVALNAPIVRDKAALRVGGFYSRDGGYIDNLTLGEKDVNRSDVYGARGDFSLRPTDRLSIRLGGFLQNISRDGMALADYDSLTGSPVDGSLDQRRLLAEPFDQRFRLLSSTIAYDLGWVALTSISSYQIVRSRYSVDLSPGFVPVANLFGGPYSTVGFPVALSTKRVTQELRLASHEPKSLEWLIGGFYNHEKSENVQEFVLRDLAGQPAPNIFYNYSAPSTYEEIAGFGDLTYHLTRRLDVSAGIRYARNNQVFTQGGSGLFIGSVPARQSSEEVVTYLANARYHFSDGATGYIRYATGYRPGGPNAVANDPVTGLPLAAPTFEADRLKSYEAGIKAESADQKFGVDLAGYVIDWTNIQISAVRNGFSVVANAPGGASVRGTEATVTVRPSRGLAAAGTLGYQAPRLSEANPDLGGAKGERLPNTPHFTAAVNADYELQDGGLRPTVGASLQYVSDRMAGFNNSLSFPQYRLPAFTTVDVRTGLTLSASTVQLYVHNLLDERGQLSGVGKVAVVQPRTVGIGASTRF
jgi:iron complex outermembrane receptor protein